MLVMPMCNEWPAPLSLHSMFKAQYKCQVIVIIIIIVYSVNKSSVDLPLAGDQYFLLQRLCLG